jgi:DNA-binding response OmpR family regulator
MKKILIVDDQADIRKLMKVLLDFRYEVLQSANVDEASQIVSSWNPDVILLDIMMPGMNGLEWCKKLKGEDSGKAIKVIMVSARATKNDIETGMFAGADDYIVKPFSPMKLLSAIETHLS